MKKRYSIGVAGYSGQSFDVNLAERNVVVGIFALLRLADVQPHQAEIVSGYTAIGIPRLAYVAADRLGMRTIGIACSKAAEFEVWPVDNAIIVGDEWGDESDAFLDRIDALLRVGGGKQSLEEADRFRKQFRDKPIFEIPLPTLN